MPRLHRLWGPILLLVALAACGQVEPVLVAVSMPDCAHQGATSMEEGEVSLILRLNGLGDAGLVLVELADDREYTDMVEHLRAEPRWTGPPTWAREVTSLRIEGGIGIDSVEESFDLAGGSYALVCVDHSSEEGPLAQPAAPLAVVSG